MLRGESVFFIQVGGRVSFPQNLKEGSVITSYIIKILIVKVSFILIITHQLSNKI